MIEALEVLGQETEGRVGRLPGVNGRVDIDVDVQEEGEGGKRCGWNGWMDKDIYEIGELLRLVFGENGV